MKQCQYGFTLVELMVAMAIGTLIILGAGQLFLTTFQTFQNVNQVSRYQETLIFAVRTLTEAGRKGNIDNYAIVTNERSADSDARYFCVLQDETKSQPLVDLAQVDESSGCPVLSKSNDDGVSHLTTLLIGDCRKGANGTCDKVVFTISERKKVITSQEPAL